jgi:hypothetical protein
MKKYIFIPFGLIVFVTILLCAQSISSFLIEDGNFGWVLTDVIVRVLLISSLAATIFCAIGNLLKRVLKTLISFIVAFAITFVFQPIYADDYGVAINTHTLDIDLVYEKFPDLAYYEEPYLVAFFTSTCRFCELTAVNFSINKSNLAQPKTVILFPSILVDAEDFLKRTNTDFEFGLITDEQFTINSGAKYPSVFLVQKGEVLNHWVGSEINFSVLDYLKQITNLQLVF